MQRMLTFHAISEMYGVDSNRDGVFDVLLPAGAESSPGIKVGADDGTGERRCAVVFDLGGFATNTQFLGIARNMQLLMVSAQLSLDPGDERGLGLLELHGFGSGPTVALVDLTISNRLYAWPIGSTSTGVFPIDVTTFVRSQLAVSARYMGFSVRNVDTIAGAGSIHFHTFLDTHLTRGSQLAITLEIPWALPRPDVPTLVVEVRPPEPWALPRSDVPGLVAEMLSSVIHRWEGHSPASPTLQILKAMLISETAASMTDAGARPIQQQALEMISKIATDEIGRLDREQP